MTIITGRNLNRSNSIAMLKYSPETTIGKSYILYSEVFISGSFYQN